MAKFDTVIFTLDHFGSILNIKAVPFKDEIKNNVPFKHNVFINDVFKGALSNTSEGWKWDNDIESNTLAYVLGECIFKWYE
jgi:hypothetical protein